MAEVDDVEEAEDDGESEAEHGVERPVDQPDEQLPEQGLRRHHGIGAAARLEAWVAWSRGFTAPFPGWLLLRQRALALVERPERLLGRDGGAHLVVIPRALGLRGLLHLEEIHRMDLAAVGADGALAEEGVVGRHLLHLRDDLR